MDEILRIAVLQTAFDEHEDAEHRLNRVTALVRGQRGADLIVLPELWAYGAFTPSSWADTAELVDGSIAQALSAAARDVGATLHAGSIIESAAHGAYPGAQGRGLWNTSVVFGADGTLAGSYRKIHRFGFGEGEPTLIEAGEDPTVIDLPQGRIGLATCYDLRFPEMFRTLVDLGALAFVVPAAWPAPRREHWELLGRARALENQAFMVQCNTTGSHGGLEMGGHSQIVDPRGEVLARAGDGEQVLTLEIDLNEARRFRRDFPVLEDRRIHAPTPDAAFR